MKRLARNNMLNIENIDSRGPPRNKNWPRGDSSEHREKHVKIKEVDKKDVGMMAGLIEMTRSSRGPKPRPVSIKMSLLKKNCHGCTYIFLNFTKFVFLISMMKL